MLAGKYSLRVVALAVLISLAGLSPLLSVEVIVPNALADVQGNTNNSWPFDCFTTMRYQQVYLGSELQTGAITQIGFRQKSDFSVTFGPVVLPGVTIELSTTSATPSSLSSNFAANSGLAPTVVFSGDLSLSGTFSANSPTPFDVLIPLTTSFVFDSAGGENLLLDVSIPSCAFTTVLDATSVLGDSVARVFSSDHLSSTGSVDSLGLVTQFSFDEGNSLLTIPPQKPVMALATVDIPIGLATDRSDLVGAAFSINYDESCLDFDASDDDFDGLPDAIVFHTPANYHTTAFFDLGDEDGEIDISIFDAFATSPLAEGTLATVTFTTTCTPLAQAPVIAPVAFSTDPAVSFSTNSAQSVVGATVDGSVEIFHELDLLFVDNFELGTTDAWTVIAP